MSVSLEIVPASRSLLMYGEADPASAYSLSGHVSVSLSSPNSLLDLRRTTRILLQSVVVTFEGQNEILCTQTGYAASRLCTVSQEIIPPEPMELSNEDHDDEEPCTWNIIFNLQVPGWLPATASFTDEDCGIRYTLFAEAKYTILDDQTGFPWSFNILCAPFRSRHKIARTKRSVSVERLELPSTRGSALTTRNLTFLVSSTIPACPESTSRRIPSDILSKIRVMATIPETIDMNGPHLALAIRMRTQGLDAEDCNRIQISGVSADIQQKETYRTRPSANYLRRHPLPRSRDQPPNRLLRDPHPVCAVYDIGLGHYGYDETHSRGFSVVCPGANRLHSLGDDNRPFENDTEPGERTWYTLEMTVPFAQGPSQPQSDPEWTHPNPFILRPTMSSPLVTVKHDICISLICSYTFPDSEEVATEILTFSVPGSFVRFAPEPLSRCATPPSVLVDLSEEAGPVVPSMIPSPTYAPTLPAYSQLYDCNGERKIDYSDTLPLYTPPATNKEETPAAPVALEDKSPSAPFLTQAPILAQ